MQSLASSAKNFGRLIYRAEHYIASLLSSGHCRLCLQNDLLLLELHGLPFMPRRLCQTCLLSLVQTPLSGLIVAIANDQIRTIPYYSVAIYQGDLRKIIHQIKYEGDQMLALDMPPLLLPALRSSLEANSVNVLVPVPLHPDKQRERGFNQCAILARGLHQLATISGANLKLAPGLLKRTKYTLPQKGLKAEERQANVEGAFCSVTRLNGEHIIILDDVLTSGATISTCARVLLQSGASKVSALTLGRASWRNQQFSSAPPAETWEQHGIVSHQF